MTEISGFKQLASPWYSDQILPFDITLAGTNEMGAASTMKIFGVEILNEGSGVSIDDAVTEMQATFVARYVEPWTAVKGPRPFKPRPFSSPFILPPSPSTPARQSTIDLPAAEMGVVCIEQLWRFRTFGPFSPVQTRITPQVRNHAGRCVTGA